ncbi:MAG: hypothetical protein WDM89_07795 [Rhizomicrobium sp.]
MLHDPEFHAGQAYAEMPTGLNVDFDIYRLFEGILIDPTQIGLIPDSIRQAVDWPIRRVSLCPHVLHRHVRNHDKHPLGFDCIRWIPWVIEHGSVMQDRKDNLVFFMRIPELSRAYFWLPVEINKARDAIRVKSFHKRDPKNVCSKIRRHGLLRIGAGFN